MASGNGISGLLHFKHFWGSMPPDLPSDSRLRRSFCLPPQTQLLLATAMHTSTWVQHFVLQLSSQFRELGQRIKLLLQNPEGSVGKLYQDDLNNSILSERLVTKPTKLRTEQNFVDFNADCGCLLIFVHTEKHVSSDIRLRFRVKFYRVIAVMTSRLNLQLVRTQTVYFEIHLA